MSLSYAKAREAHLRDSLVKRGSCFEGLSDLTRWYSLTAAEAAGLALAVGLRLSEGEVQELRAAIHATAEANALACGKEPTPAEATIDAFLKEEATPVPALPPIKSYARKV